MHKAGPGLPEGRRGARWPPCSGAGRPPDRVPPRQVRRRRARPRGSGPESRRLRARAARRGGPQPPCPEARRYLLVPFPAPGLGARRLRPPAAAGRGGNIWFGGRAGSGDPGRGKDKCRGSRGSRGAPERAVRRGRGRGRLRSAPGVGARGRRCPRKRGEPGVGAAARETRPETLLARVVRLLFGWNRSQLALAPGARLSCGCPCPRASDPGGVPALLQDLETPQRSWGRCARGARRRYCLLGDPKEQNVFPPCFVPVLLPPPPQARQRVLPVQSPSLICRE